MTSRDTSQVIPYEPVVIVGRADRDPNRAWSAALPVADELGEPASIEHPQPRAIDVLVSLGAAFAAIVFTLLAIAMTLIVVGGVR